MKSTKTKRNALNNNINDIGTCTGTDTFINNNRDNYKKRLDSWHNEYRNSSYIYISGLDLRLTEGDVAIVFSQWGEPVDVKLVRDKRSGLSKGYCFLCYEDQKSTILAVDNANGMLLLGRRIKVDHVRDYRPSSDGSYSFTGAEGGGIGVFGVTRDIQTRYETELRDLHLHFREKGERGGDGTTCCSSRRVRSLSRSLSVER